MLLIKRIIFLLAILLFAKVFAISQHTYSCSSDTECEEERDALYCLILCQR